MSREDADTIAALNRWMARAWAAEREAVEAGQMCASLRRDIAYLSTELVKERARGEVLKLELDAYRTRGVMGVSSRGDVTAPGEFDGALQQIDPAHGREP